MKAFQSIVVITIAALFIQATPIKESERTGIQFFDGTWEEALQTAEAENKLIFLDAYASWCGPCKLMKRNVFSNAAVKEYFDDHFISMAVDMEKGMGRQLAQRYRVTAYPTLFFLDAEGNVVKKAVGYHNVQQFLALAKSVEGADS